MVNETIEEKVIIKDSCELFKPELFNKWVNINGKDEFIIHSVQDCVSTLYIEQDYVIKNYYNNFLASLKPVYIEKFLKETGEGRKYLKIIEPKENN